MRHRVITGLRNLDLRGIRWLAHRLPIWVIPAPAGEVVLRTLHGFSLFIDPVTDRGIERTLYYTGTYERGTLHLLSHLLQPGDTFVDAGANIGLMSVFASRMVGPAGMVVAFEPNPGTLEILKRNVELNRAWNIIVSGEALGSSTGKGIIYDRWDSNRGSSSLVHPGFEAKGHEVKITTLDHYFSTSSVRIAVIKMDIEGYELEALRGARGILESPEPPALVLECGKETGSTDQQALMQFITRLNRYRIYRLTGGKDRISLLEEICPSSGMPSGDNIFCLTPAQYDRLDSRLFR